MELSTTTTADEIAEYLKTQGLDVFLTPSCPSSARYSEDSVSGETRFVTSTTDSIQLPHIPSAPLYPLTPLTAWGSSAPSSACWSASLSPCWMPESPVAILDMDQRRTSRVQWPSAHVNLSNQVVGNDTISLQHLAQDPDENVLHNAITSSSLRSPSWVSAQLAHDARHYGVQKADPAFGPDESSDDRAHWSSDLPPEPTHLVLSTASTPEGSSSSIAPVEEHRPGPSWLSCSEVGPTRVKREERSPKIDDQSISPSFRTVDDHEGKGKQRKATRRPTTPSRAKFTCSECKMIFERKWNLTQHLQKHADSRPRPWQCDWVDCGLAFLRENDLVRHRKAVSVLYGPVTHAC